MESALNQSLLSPSISYYVRKLLRQNFDRLKFVVAMGAGLKADPLADLNAVLQSLYLDENEVSSAVKDLERLASYHQILSNQGSKHRQELDKVEQEIFWLLGFKRQELPNLGAILLVDDSPENLRLLSTALTKHGYETRSALNGEAALKTIKTSVPNLVLMDVMMPIMDGYETCRQIKADPQTSDVPVIFISAIDNILDKVKAFEVGGADYIMKPFHIEEVLTRVEHQLKIHNLQKRIEAQNVSLQAKMNDSDASHQTLLLTQLILERLADYILVVNADARVIYANSAAEKQLGYTTEELCKLTLLDLEESLTVDTWRSQWQTLKHQGSLNYNCTHCSASSTHLQVAITIINLGFNNQDNACVAAYRIAGRV